MWRWLPPTLTSLHIRKIPYSDLIPAFPGDSSRKGLLKCSFEDLPSSLTHLVVHFGGHTLIRHFDAPETDGASRTFKSEPTRLFPPKLKLLTTKNGHLTAEAAKQLPRSLTEFDTYQLTSDVCGALPCDLKVLRVHGGVIFTPELIKNLPRALTHLDMPMMTNEEICIFEETGKVTTYADMLQRQQEKYEHKSSDTSMLWQGDYVLPSALTYLDLHNHEYLDDRCVAALPKKLNFCDLKNCSFITDLSIPSLPRYLSTLDLSGASMVTSRTFKDLPRQLSFLSLASSKEIFDEHIKDLPSRLDALRLDGAIHLTNVCIKDLPRGLETFLVRSNELITIESFSDFPRGVRCPFYCNSFQAAHWSIHLGEIKLGLGYTFGSP